MLRNTLHEGKDGATCTFNVRWGFKRMCEPMLESMDVAVMAQGGSVLS